MNIRKSLLLSVATVALAAPGFSFAAPMSAPANGASAANSSQDYFKSQKTRAEVMQELAIYRKENASLLSSELERGLTAPAKTVGAQKTRAEVMQELATYREENASLLNSELERGLTAPAKTVGAQKTRTEVQKELFAGSSEYKDPMQKVYDQR